MLREVWQIPNLITIARILLSPILIVVFDNIPLVFAFGFFVAMTDFLDGWIARQYNLRSKLGELLDPIADKLLVLMFLIAVMTRGLLQSWMLGAMLFRDIYLLLAYPVFHYFVRVPGREYRFAARFPGKLVTVIQFLCAALLILAPREVWQASQTWWNWNFWPFLLLYPLSLWASLDYTVFLIRSSRT